MYNLYKLYIKEYIEFEYYTDYNVLTYMLRQFYKVL